MAWMIYPSETPVGTLYSEPSNRMREYQLARWMRDVKASPLDSFVYSGFDLTSFSGETGYATSGVAVVDGFRVYSDATTLISGFTVDTTYYVWVQMTFTGSLVTAATVTTTTTTTPPSNSVLIGKAVKSGGAWTSVESSIKKPQQPYAGSVVGDGTTSQFVFLGTTPKLVSILSDTPGSVIWINSTDTGTPRIDTFGFYFNPGGTYVTFYYLAWF